MLLIHENINKFIKQKGMNKKEFANKLILLEPTVSRIGETPSVSAIYGYLNGRINIPVELIPFVCDILDITEQELFDTTKRAKNRCFKYFIENANTEELEYFNNFINVQLTYKLNINYEQIIPTVLNTNDDKINKFISLLKYAPKNFLDKAIMKLEEYRLVGEDFNKNY